MLEIANLQFGYPGFSLCATFQLQRNEVVLLEGDSGAGKTTLLHLLAGFAIPDSGGLRFMGENILTLSAYQRPITMLFQTHNLFAHLSVADNIALGLHNRWRKTQEDKEAVASVAEKMGIADKLYQLPNTLSGGQQQRVALARCLLRRRPVLLLDEPFNGLDSDNQRIISDLIWEMQATYKLTLIIVSHQREAIESRPHRKIRIKNGLVTAN